MTVDGDGSKPPTWVGRATARPAAEPWPEDGRAAYPVTAVPYPASSRPGRAPSYQTVVHPVTGQPVILAYGQPPRRRRGLTAFLVVAGVFAACCAGGATVALISSAAVRGAVGIGSTPGGPTAGNQPTTPPAPTTSAPPPEPGLNAPVRDGRFEFVVTSVNCGEKSVGAGFITKQAKGQYCVVGLTVRNIGTQSQLLLDGVQKAFSADGAEYTPDTGAGVIANSGTSVWINLVDPGEQVGGKVVYDVPDGTQLALLELHDSAFSGGVDVTLA